MARYVVLLRYHSDGLKAVGKDPHALQAALEVLERWEAKVISSHQLLGEWDQMTVVDAPDNYKAWRAVVEQELGTTADTEILPAIDLPLFQRLISQSAETGGPHRWQIQWWARLVRMAMYDRTYGQWARKYFTDHTITGMQHWDALEAPCIVVSNHASHYDQMCLMEAIPGHIRNNLFFGAAADRWFLKGRKELRLKPWYQSLVAGCYPIQRGGGSKTLEYPKWLLSQGANLMLFPEGTRSRGSQLSKFKHGVSILALDAGVPVVPIYMTGLKAIRPPGSKESVPGPVGAHVLEPLRFPEGTTVPEATMAIFEAMNTVHQRALAHGDDAARADWQPPAEADAA